MRRRDLLAGSGGAFALPLVSRAQKAVPVVGYLIGGSPGHYAPYVAAFHYGLRETAISRDRTSGWNSAGQKTAMISCPRWHAALPVDGNRFDNRGGGGRLGVGLPAGRTDPCCSLLRENGAHRLLTGARLWTISWRDGCAALVRVFGYGSAPPTLTLYRKIYSRPIQRASPGGS
jgi:hypothetical protein